MEIERPLIFKDDSDNALSIRKWDETQWVFEDCDNANIFYASADDLVEMGQRLITLVQEHQKKHSLCYKDAKDNQSNNDVLKDLGFAYENGKYVYKDIGLSFISNGVMALDDLPYYIFSQGVEKGIEEGKKQVWQRIAKEFGLHCDKD